MKRLTGFLVLFLCFGSYVYAQEAKSSPYYPLKKGASWTYKSSQGGEILVKVTGTDKIGDKTGWKLETTVNTKLAATELIEIRDDGFYRYSINTTKVDTPVKFFKLPPAKGDSWDFDFKVQNQTVKGKYEIKVEDVTVNGTPYKGAFLVEGKDITIGDKKAVLKQWFVENVGIVKIQFSLDGQEGILELVKHEPGS